MYPKAKVEQIIASTAPEYLRLLKLDHLNIHFHAIQSSESPGCGDTTSAESIFNFRHPKRVDINIFYDMCKGIKDCKLSIFHELLHVKFRHINSLARKLSKQDRKRYHHLEEQIVHDIEMFFLAKFR